MPTRRSYVWMLGFVLFQIPLMVLAAGGPAANPHRTGLIQDSYPRALIGRPVRTDMAVTTADTVYLLGGPDRLDGQFQTADGEPDWQGWTSHDITQPAESHWHIDTFNCADLDPTEPDNHAWWCGMIFESCEPGDSPEGYGNSWTDYLDWYGTVADPSAGVTVRVTAQLNYDVEPGYDYLRLQHETTLGMHDQVSYDDTDVGVTVDETFALTPGDYVGPDADKVHLRWDFDSDFAWSDEDCAWPTDGAAQIDLIAVYFDQGNGEVQIGWTESCEPGIEDQWEPVLAQGCGDFAKIWPFLSDIDPCHSNSSPQVAFIDDGLVVPGTGGYLCTTWCYGPSGYIVNPEGGLAGPDHSLRNEVWSPVLEWPGDEYSGAIFACDVYLHENLCSTCPGIFFNMVMRSTNDPLGESGWTDWWNVPGQVFWRGPFWDRKIIDASGSTLADRTHVQLGLGVIELSDYADGTDGTPAPYIDNVSFKVYAYTGPLLWLQFSADLAQDNFPEIGAIDYTDLGANHVRFDAAWWHPLFTDEPVDKIYFVCEPVRTGSVLNDHPKMYYKLKANPLFDAYRTTGLPNEGFVYADSLNTAGWWAVELPDTGFFYPGDRIHYYLEAQDNVGGDIGTTRLPADTTGFSVFPGDEGYVPMLYPPDFIVRALPSLWDASPGSQPDILLWNDRWDETYGQDEAAWTTALSNIGYQEGVGYDLYWSNGPQNIILNGLGTRATATQLAYYKTLLYASGTEAHNTMTDDWNTDRDVDCLSNWLLSGNKNMFLTGDNYIYDMTQDGSAATLAFVNSWISVNFVQQDVRPLIDNQSTPLVEVVPGNPVFNAVTEWIAHGGCPDMNRFDAVVEAGNAVKIAEFTAPNGQAGVYPYAAAVYHHQADYNAKTIYLPYDFNYIMTPQGGDGARVPASLAARTRLLEEVLFCFGHIGPDPATDVPEAGVFTVKSYPNPFNPSTKIAYHMPRRGELAVKIYNIRGELVRTLIDEVIAAGDGFVMWDGTDSRGRAVASGVYFYETLAVGQVYVDKLTLVK